GTNYSRGRGQLAMHGSLLFTAPHTGTFWCQIRAHTDAGHDFKYRLTAVAAPRPGGTWLAIDNFTGDAPLWWQINTCSLNGRTDKGGTDPHCGFLGRPPGSHPPPPAVCPGAAPGPAPPLRPPPPCTAAPPRPGPPRRSTGAPWGPPRRTR